AVGQPPEERWPGLAVGVEATHALMWWRHVEHHDVLGMIGKHGGEVAVLYRLGPAFDQGTDLFLIGRHGRLDPSRLGRPSEVQPRPVPKLIARPKDRCRSAGPAGRRSGSGC